MHNVETPTPTTASLYGPVPVTLYRVDDRSTMLHIAGEDRLVPIDGALARVLAACQSSRTMEAHTAMAARALGSEDRVIAERAVRALALSGLLKPIDVADEAEDVADVCKPITAIGIITADRPTMLRRCLQTCLEQGRIYDWRARLVVVDGSRDPANRAATRQAVADAATATDLVVDYYGASEAAALVSRLADRPDSAVSAALTPGGTGASRNVLMLATAGERLLTLDDDVICRGWSSGEGSGGVLAGHDEMRRLEFFDTRERALAFGRPASAVDVLGSHQAVLGRSLRGLCRDAGAGLEAESACRHLITALHRRAPFRVRLTFSGLAGDAGVHCPHNVLFARGRLRERFFRDPGSLQTALTSREIVRVAERLILTHDASCMIYCAGLANDELMPPFMLRGRNADGVFGAMLSFADAMSMSAHLPHGVFHDSSRPSLYEEGEIPSASVTRFCDVLIAATRQAEQAAVAKGMATRLSRLALVLHELAQLETDEFIDWFRHATLMRRCQSIQQLVLERDCPTGAPPEHWQAAWARWRDRFIEVMGEPEFLVPLEFRSGASVRDCFREVQAFVLLHARLIDLWPALWHAARE